MKICVLTHTFPRNEKDVAAAFMKEFCDGLTQNGNQVVLLTPFDKKFKRTGDPFKIFTYKYIWPEKLHMLGYSKTMDRDIKVKKRAFLFLPFLILFGSISLFKIIRKEKIDLISVHWILPNGLIAWLVAKLTNTPYVITLPGTDAYLAYRYKIFGWFAKIIAEGSAGIVSNSSWHMKRILRLGVKNKPTAIISYPVDVSKFKPFTGKINVYKKKLGLNQGAVVILAVGRLVYKKGFAYLIKALPQVLKKIPEARLLIGGEGDLREELENISRNLNLTNKIIFLGTIQRDEIIHYYNLADIMVAPSIVDKDGNVDGGPLVSIESMACKKPQIVTNILGVADIVKDGKQGYVVPQKNSGALAGAIIKIATSKKLSEQMGQLSRELVVKELSTRYIGKEYTDFFTKAV